MPKSVPRETLMMDANFRGVLPQNNTVSVARTTQASDTIGMAVPSNGQTASLNCAAAGTDPKVPTVSGGGQCAKPPRPATNSGKTRGKPQQWPRKGPQPGQARDIGKQLNVYHRTRWYKDAVMAGFKNKTALDKFNRVVKAFDDQIDPACIPVCTECGHSDLELCDHFITAKGVVVVDGAVAIPAGEQNIRFYFNWVERVKRMFTWPSFNTELPVNHNSAGFDNSQLPDDYLWPELAAYLRLYRNTSYEINGVFDREAKLAHYKKLALRYFDEGKIKMTDRLTASFINRMNHTIQACVDSRDDETLFACSTVQYNSFWKAPSALLSKIPLRALVIAGVIASPWLVSKLVIANWKLQGMVVKRIFETNFRILVSGSGLLLKQLWAMLKIIGIVLKESTPKYLKTALSAALRHLLSLIQQLSCKVAGITSLKASTDVISKIPPQLSPSSFVGTYSTTSSTALHLASGRTFSRLMQRIL